MLKTIHRVALALMVLSASLASAQEDYDQWYVLEMLEQRAGYMHNSQETKDERITTTSDMKLTIKRGQQAIEIDMKQVWVETADHEPLSITSSHQIGAQPTSRTYTFQGDTIKVETRAGEQVLPATTIPVPDGDWLTPAQAAAAFAKAIDEGRTTISQTLLQPDLTALMVITSEYSNIEQTTVEVLGKTVPAYRADVTSDLHPEIAGVTYFNRQGISLREELDMGVASILTLASDKALALSKLDPPEVMASTFVSPTGRFKSNPRLVRKASYVLSVADGTLSELPQTGIQRVEVLNDKSARVVVDLDAHHAAGDVDTAIFLEASSLVDSKDKRIVSLAQKATRHAGDDPADRAEAMRRFVYDYVEEKDLGVGFATASEVCLTRAGDCSEHAVLLAAMLRADGIPARTVSGVVYVDSFLGQDRIFGYHMWAQALLDIDGELTWVDVDGTFPGNLAMDATHIALGVSSMSDGEAFDGLMSLVPLLGRLQIEIE